MNDEDILVLILKEYSIGVGWQREKDTRARKMKEDEKDRVADPL